MTSDIFEAVSSAVRGLEERLSARTAYGEPITASGVTVVPVAKVGFGFGGGGGGGTGTGPSFPHEGFGEAQPSTPSGSGGGGGGGGGGFVQPIGFVEITDQGARWMPLEPPRGEILLRSMTAAALLLPGGGRRGFFGRLALLVLAQAVYAAISRPRIPAMPGTFAG